MAAMKLFGCGFATISCIMALVTPLCGVHLDCSKDAQQSCSQSDISVFNLTDLMREYTYVMDRLLPEDAAKGNLIQKKFSEQLNHLQALASQYPPQHQICSLLLLEAVKGVSHSRGNIIKDHMARHDMKEVWPVYVDDLAKWTPNLFEQLLASELFRIKSLGAFEAVRSALHEAVKLRLLPVVDGLLRHVMLVWKEVDNAGALAGELLPVAIGTQSWPLAEKLLKLSTQSLSISEQLQRLRTPSSLLSSHASAWHVAETMCMHFLDGGLKPDTNPIADSCTSCSVHRWLLATLVNTSVPTANPDVIQGKADDYCQAVVAFSKPSVNRLLPVIVSSQGTDQMAPDGGWQRGSYIFGADEGCSVARYDGATMSREEFANLDELSLPALIVNVEPLRGDVQRLFTRENTQKLFDSADLLAGHVPYGEVFGLYSGIATGREMLEYLDSKWRQYAATAQLWEDQGGRLINSEEPPLYVFDNMVLQKKLNQSGAGLPYSLPGFLPSWKQQVHQFIWGSPGSGAPVHFHCPAINMMAYGRKRWTLYPPGDAHYSTVHPLHSRPPGARPRPEGLQCVQHPGEILFVPSHWAHSTVNIDQTIGIAVEFDLPFC